MTKLKYEKTKVMACDKIYEILFEKEGKDKSKEEVLNEVLATALAYSIVDGISSSMGTAASMAEKISITSNNFLDINGIQIAIKPKLLKLKDVAKCIVSDYTIVDEDEDCTIYGIECYPNITNIYYHFHERVPYSIMEKTNYLRLPPEKKER